MSRHYYITARACLSISPERFKSTFDACSSEFVMVHIIAIFTSFVNMLVVCRTKEPLAWSSFVLSIGTLLSWLLKAAL